MTERMSFINAIATAVPEHDIHADFIAWAEQQLEERARPAFRRMAARSGIEHRWSVLPPTGEGGSPVAPGGYYFGAVPPTSQRMETYAAEAPALALRAIAKLDQAWDGVSHLVVASCTGFTAPGIDQIIAAELGLDPSVERTLVGFMGCYAAVSALKVAHHIVRSEPEARVLVVTVELSSLHLQFDRQIEPLLAMLQFGDGAAAAIVTAEPSGFAISRLFATTLPDTPDLIRWTIGDQGFAMHLSGQVPGHIAHALDRRDVRDLILGEDAVTDVDSWAIHAGGRSILDAVETGLGLSPDMLRESREVLARFGNMSSSTLMFVLSDLLDHREHERGVAMAFGPGLAVEGFRFERAR
jgi:alpha-pyrone synthase